MFNKHPKGLIPENYKGRGVVKLQKTILKEKRMKVLNAYAKNSMAAD